MMEAGKLFDLIQTTIQAELDKDENQHVYVEREMRGTYPTLIVRVLASERKRKPKAGAIILSSQKAAESVPEAVS